MNLRSLRYFLTVAECGSITRAALELHITQPSLTQHLKYLEDHFGVALFMRHGRGVILTDAGKLLRVRGGALNDQIEGLRDELESSVALPRGTLSVGMPISWSELVTYPVIMQFRRLYPDVRIKLVVNASEALATEMSNNEIQLAVLTEVDDLTPFRSTPVIEDGLFLVGPAGSQLNQREPVMLADIVDYPMILPLNSTVGLRRIDRALAAVGRRLNCVVETASNNILPLIARGAGYTALGAAGLPALGTDSPYEAVQISNMSMIWAFATPKNRPKTAAVSAFEALLTDQIAVAVLSGAWKTARILTRPDRTPIEPEGEVGD
jgi:LysR family nitrogen assimilation transcriptional regulator